MGPQQRDGFDEARGGGILGRRAAVVDPGPRRCIGAMREEDAKRLQIVENDGIVKGRPVVVPALVNGGAMGEKQSQNFQFVGSVCRERRDQRWKTRLVGVVRIGSYL